MKTHSSIISLILIVILWLVLTLGCAKQGDHLNPTQAPNSNVKATIKPIIDIPQLIGKSPTQLEKVLGKPATITKTNDPDMVPGEYRDYKIDNALNKLTQEGLMVRFYKGQAVHFSLDLPRLADTPEEALLMAGIDVKGALANIKAPRAVRWTGNFNGIQFKDVAALKLDTDSSKYSTVQAESAK